MARLDRTGCGGSSGALDCEEGADDPADVGISSFTMACSIAERTLQVFSCLLRSDLAALGAFLSRHQLPYSTRAVREWVYVPKQFYNSGFRSIADHTIRILEQLHQRRNVAAELQPVFLVHL